VVVLEAILVACQNRDKVVLGHVIPVVVEDAALVEIGAILLVVESTREGILFVPGYVSIRHDDDLISWDAHLQVEMVGVADVSLVSIVVEALRTSD